VNVNQGAETWQIVLFFCLAAIVVGGILWMSVVLGGRRNVNASGGTDAPGVRSQGKWARRGLSTIFLPILLAAAGFTAGWLLNSKCPDQAPLPVLGQVPDYTLTDQLGRQVSSTAFLGKVRMVTFLFTYCKGYCPLIAHNLMTVERVLRTAGLADQVQLVAFNVDPGETGPAEMRAFQQQFGWNPQDTRWEFLTGSPQEIRRIVTGAYHVSYRKVADDDQARESDPDLLESPLPPEPVVANKLADEAGVDYDIVHNDMLAIVDTQGRIRMIFDDADRVSDEQMVNVVRRLIEASDSSGAD
jgi:protein SCO1/2